MWESIWSYIIQQGDAFIVSLVVLIPGTIITIIITKTVGRRVKHSITYLINTHNLITGYSNNDIRVTFKGSPAVNVTVTKIALWNNGNTRLSKSEITDIQPITISIQEYDILSVNIIKQSNNDCGFIFRMVSSSNYVIDFNYMNFKEVCVVQVVHIEPNEDYISLHCMLKNRKKISKKYVTKKDGTFDKRHQYRSGFPLKSALVAYFYFVLMIFFYAIKNFIGELQIILSLPIANWPVWVSIVLLIISIVAFAYGVVFAKRILIPKSLEKEFTKQNIKIL